MAGEVRSTQVVLDKCKWKRSFSLASFTVVL